MKKWLFNPFVYVAGSKALLIGLCIMLLTAITGFYSHTHFDGAIDMHVGKPAPMYVYLIEQAIDWLSVVIIFFIAGKVFSRSSIRFIDVAGTIALARWPALVAAVIGFGIVAPTGKSIDEIVAGINALTIVYSLLSAVFMIWMIALFYNAFTISCNIKGGKAVGAFIGGLIIAEVLSKIVLSLVYKTLM